MQLTYAPASDEYPIETVIRITHEGETAAGLRVPMTACPYRDALKRKYWFYGWCFGRSRVYAQTGVLPEEVTT